MAIRDSGGLDEVVFIIIVVSELTLRDPEARRARGRILGCSSLYR